MDWLLTPKDILLGVQLFSVLHIPLWLIRHNLTSERHQQIRQHVRLGHGGRFMGCGDCVC